MKNYLLDAVKEFAEYNFNLPDEEQVTVETEFVNLSNPWMDQSGRFELTDYEAVKEWGLPAVVAFYEKAMSSRQMVKWIAERMEMNG